MKITPRLRERFCKDCNVPINIFEEPYFTDRLKLYDKVYNTLYKWNLFVKELEKYHCEQDYFEEYNRVKDEAIMNIKNSEGYKRLNEEDMNKFKIKNTQFPKNDIYKPTNDKKVLVSIDMKKANFSSLRYYDKGIFNNANTWEDFISQFTDNKHIINSKYIRQVILGNCNPSRHITYEKHLMDIYLSEILPFLYSKYDVISFTNDEIIIDVRNDDNSFKEFCTMWKNISKKVKVLDGIPLKIELFQLHKIENTDGYIKKILSNPEYFDDLMSYKFKCFDNLILPFVMRKFLNEEVTENDKVFYNKGLLSKFIEIPEIDFLSMYRKDEI